MSAGGEQPQDPLGKAVVIAIFVVLAVVLVTLGVLMLAKASEPAPSTPDGLGVTLVVADDSRRTS